MLRNRQTLREQIRKEMFEVVKGWGVWLETVEITDVKIMSGQLFKDLQANYRENMKKEAEVYRMSVESEINVVKTQKSSELTKVVEENKAIFNDFKADIDFQIKKQLNIDQEIIQKVNQERTQVSTEFEIFQNNLETVNQIARQASDRNVELLGIDNQVLLAKEEQKVNDARFDTEKVSEQASLDRQKLENDAKLANEKALMELKRKNLTPEVMQLQAMEAARRAFKGKYFGTLEYVKSQPPDVLNQLIGSFLA